MDWMMPVNEILTDEVTKLNNTLVPPGHQGNGRSTRDLAFHRNMMDSLCKIIDTLGEASAKVQGLKKTITTAEKVRNSAANILYLLKDAMGKNGKGEVIGFLKVGHKNLFLFDEKDKVWEVEPLCVLDFYIIPERQRFGYGKVLYDFMLRDVDASPHELAIDGPSPKMKQFLSKNYGIDVLLRQSNNFAISPQFFSLIPDINKSSTSTPTVNQMVGRFAAPQPPSSIASIIHGENPQDTSGFRRSSRKIVNSPVPLLEKRQPRSQTRSPTFHSTIEFNYIEPEETSERNNAKVKKPVEKEKTPERPSTLTVEPVASSSTSDHRASQMADHVYFDMKHYHYKLW